MKNKYLLVYFIIGIIIVILGSLMKITHWQFGFVNGNFLLSTGMFVQVIAGILFIVKLLSNDQVNEFLNK